MQQKQSKISAFFKPQQHKHINSPNPFHHNNHFHKENEVLTPNHTSTPTDNGSSILYKSKILNKKRNYAQLHLDLGQSDFLLRTCSICGFKYACGDEGDEGFHKEFHKDYIHGIKFKGWKNERVVSLPSSGAGRIILVLDSDPPAHRKKVQKVVEMMEMELGSGWLIHKLCKVYLFILHERVVGCLVAEPIKTAYRAFSNSCLQKSLDGTDDQNGTNSVSRKPETIEFHRVDSAVLFLDKEVVPAACGIRAIWVVSSMRRKYIATQLLDAARSSFCGRLQLARSQLAFSDLTSAGNVLASRYCATTSLFYKSDV